jgi:hypothetical protein
VPLGGDARIEIWEVEKLKMERLNDQQPEAIPVEVKARLAPRGNSQLSGLGMTFRVGSSIYLLDNNDSKL